MQAFFIVLKMVQGNLVRLLGYDLSAIHGVKSWSPQAIGDEMLAKVPFSRH